MNLTIINQTAAIAGQVKQQILSKVIVCRATKWSINEHQSQAQCKVLLVAPVWF